MQLERTGRVAIVTGASKGIGLAVTRTLLQEGGRVPGATLPRSSSLDAGDASGPTSSPRRRAATATRC